MQDIQAASNRAPRGAWVPCVPHDIVTPDATRPGPAGLRRVFDYLHAHYAESVRVHALADVAGMSMAELNQRFLDEYQLTPQQMLTRLRIESAMRFLRGSDSMAMISQACGFADQSAFTRQFKATVGMTPRSYRLSVAAAMNG